MQKINPFVGLFAALATLMAAFFIPVFVILLDHSERLAAIEATVAGHDERFARIEARLDDVEDAIATTNERMARIEGTVAGALGRPFPERMAEAPDNDPAAGEAGGVDG